jgi:methionine synthase II (cobalamin-independent)
MIDTFVKELKDFGVRFVQVKEPLIQYSENITCRGFFSHEELLLKVSSCNERLEIFIHEFSHFRQYKMQTEIWRKATKNNSILKFDNWLNHVVEYSNSEIKNIINDVYLLEKECEDIAMDLIKEYNLDMPQYESNARKYLNLYSTVLKTRKFDSSSL